jgi:hypothetical protein
MMTSVVETPKGVLTIKIKTMKTYTNVTEWLKSKPTEVEIQKVLDLVNRGAKKELRIELYKKQNDLKKLNRFVLEMNELGFKPSADVTVKVNGLVNEIKEMQEQLPTPVKKVKKEKEVKTPTIIETKIEE